MRFTTVTAEQARADRYYGFDGWLVVFYVYAAWTAASSAAVLLAFMFFEPAFQPFEKFDLGGFHTLTAVRAISLLPFLILAPLKHRLMPIATIASEWANTVVTSILTPSTWTSMFEGFFQFMLTAAEQGALHPEFPMAASQFGGIMEVFVQAAMWQAIVLGVAMTALFTWYLLASKRVNATYRHRLPSEVS